MNDNKLKIGNRHNVIHSRKGRFIFKVEKDDGEWVSGQIVQGKAKMISRTIDDIGEGERITIRKSFCKFSKMQLPAEITN